MATPLSAVRCTAWVAVAFVFLVPQTFGQTWSTGNFNTNSGWVRGYSIIASNQPVGLRWEGNDVYNPTTDLGENDNIMRMIGYTPGASGVGNSSWVQGGYFAADGIFPGTNNVKVWRSFTPATGSPTGDATFKTQWSLIGSLDGSFPQLDTFAFDLRTADNTVSLLRLDLTPGIATIPNGYTLQSVVDAGPAVNRIDLGYQAVYELTVAITGSLYDLSVAQINPSDQSIITNFFLVSGGALTAGLGVDDFGTVSMDWALASGDPADPGSNYIIVNDVSVVPEPSTYALLALSVFALMAAGYRRRLRR
jgi:hypothetical protein